MNKKRAKIGIFTLAFILLATNAISPAMASISAAFPEASPSVIQLVLLIPQLMSVPFVIFGGAIADRFSKKKLIMIGLVLFAGSGIVGFFTQSLAVLIASRAAFGVGYGLLVPCSLGIASDIFFGTDEFERVIGMEYSLKSIGSIFYTLFAGMLCEISWHHTFLVYLSGAVVLVITFFVIPDITPKPQDEESVRPKKSPAHRAVPPILVPVLLVGFACSFFIQINNSHFSYLIEKGGFGTSSVAGIVSSVCTVGAAVGAWAYDRLLKRLDDKTLLLGIFSCAVGFLVGVLARSLAMVFVCALLLGFGLGLTNPALLMLVGRDSQENSTLFFSLVMASMNLGSMLQGVVIPQITAAIFGGDGLGRSAFIIACLGMTLCLCASAVMLARYRPSGQKEDKP